MSGVEEHVAIDADRQLLASAVSNLVENAFKFSKRGGTVTLTTRATAERVFIDVEATPAGVSPGQDRSPIQASFFAGRLRSIGARPRALHRARRQPAPIRASCTCTICRAPAACSRSICRDSLRHQAHCPRRCPTVSTGVSAGPGTARAAGRTRESRRRKRAGARPSGERAAETTHGARRLRTEPSLSEPSTPPRRRARTHDRSARARPRRSPRRKWAKRAEPCGSGIKRRARNPPARTPAPISAGRANETTRSKPCHFRRAKHRGGLPRKHRWRAPRQLRQRRALRDR